MEHWNGVILIHVIDPVCYISKLLNLNALIFGLIGSLNYCFSFQSQIQYHQLKTCSTLIMHKSNEECKRIWEACKARLFS